MAKKNRGTPFRSISQAPIIGQVATNERKIENLQKQIILLQKEMKEMNDTIVNFQFTLSTLRRCLGHSKFGVRRLILGLWRKRWVKTSEAFAEEMRQALEEQKEAAKLKAKEVKRGNPEGTAE